MPSRTLFISDILSPTTSQTKLKSYIHHTSSRTLCGSSLARTLCTHSSTTYVAGPRGMLNKGEPPFSLNLFQRKEASLGEYEAPPSWGLCTLFAHNNSNCTTVPLDPISYHIVLELVQREQSTYHLHTQSKKETSVRTVSPPPHNIPTPSPHHP